jgi:predicted  nucleic acid-binding Zn-ribbon protein
MKVWENGIVREMTEEEIVELQEQTYSPEQQILHLKQMLNDTKDQVIEYVEGLLTDEEYAPIKEQRQAWRDEINRLENVLEEGAICE